MNKLKRLIWLLAGFDVALDYGPLLAGTYQVAIGAFENMSFAEHPAPEHWLMGSPPSAIARRSKGTMNVPVNLVVDPD